MPKTKVNVRIKGVEKMQRGFGIITSGLRKTRKHDEELAKRIASRARMLAPKDTGRLRRSIRATSNPPGVRAGGAEAYYAVYQEVGFGPHPIPIRWIVEKQSPGELTLSPMGFAMVRKHTPFMAPAVREIMGPLPSLMRYRDEKQRFVRGIIKKALR